MIKPTMLALMASVFLLAACNTVKGVARDVQSGARALEEAADEVAN